MQSLQCNSEASCQTFLSIPPHCTRQMLRKAGDTLGTVNGVSYQEYFDGSSHTILTPSPERYSIHDTKKEEIRYEVSSVFALNEENELQTSENEYSEESVQPEDGEDRGAVCVERPDESNLKEYAVTEVPPVGSQGDAALSENLKGTAVQRNAEFSHSVSPPALEKGDKYNLHSERSTLTDAALSKNLKGTAVQRNAQFSHSVLPPALEKGDEYNLDSERSTLTDSDHSLVSSTKVEVGSQPDLVSVDASSYELVSLIGSSQVTKPLMEAQSEGKCQKKKTKKGSKNLKRVSRSVPHVMPLEMQHLNDFSRAVTQEAIYAEMSSGDDAFGGSQDQYDDDEEESSYSSESDDDTSQTNSQEIDDLAMESSSSFPAPIAPPGSATSSPGASSSVASRHEDCLTTESGSTFQDESTSRFSSEQSSEALEALTDSCVDQLCGGSSEGLMSSILRHPEISLSSLSPDSKTPSPCATGSACIATPITASSRQEERECKAKRLEKLVERLCEDFVAQNPAVKNNPASLVSYFESAGAVIRCLPMTQLKCSGKNVSRDPAASATSPNKSQASSETSRVASLESIKQARK